MGTLFVFLAIFCTFSLNLTNGYEPYYFSDDNGIPHFVDADEYMLTNDDFIELAANLSSVKFLLYTRQNPKNGYVLKMSDPENFFNSNWNKSNPTRIVTHGWRGNGNSESCVEIRDAFLKVNDYNIIVIDWGVVASDIIYSKVRACIPNVAKYVGAFIDYLNFFGDIELDKTLMIGHSLGAHLISLSAKHTDGQIGEVLGLDPAGPGYHNSDPNKRIHKSHADYVQVIHTNAGKLGLGGNIGMSDFHMNGGKSQPGCHLDIFGNCAHARSYRYFAESIVNHHGFRATPVTCNKSPFTCPSVYMGGPTLDHSAQGAYTLPTASKPPFALG
ncbi:PREDICTED: lipase member H-like [Polistes dominula]|uniref:phospholipase A1 n=1 Tax=Polistes dominula TaxID=743375 RepID=A0ABM1IQP6_POLDO|nr:PREDICTED: lipase member H-like [Polistes dominula]